MKKIIFAVSIILATFLFDRCNSINGNAAAANISFYDVPLVCGADPTIGCGSRIKPLFIEAAKQKEIKESWVNREGTVIAFAWADNKPSNDLAQKLFKQFDIESSPITDEKQINELTAGMHGKQTWYQGMAVDSLSLHEAGTIAGTLTQMAGESGLMTADELAEVKTDVEAYFKTELVKVRTHDNLESAETQDKWQQDAFDILVSHVGKERGKKIADYVNEKRMAKQCEQPDKKSCCDKDDKKKDCCKKK